MKAIKNWQTTAWGFIGGLATYITTVGVKIPETRQEWGAFVLGAVVAGLGAAAKDGATGSAPGQST